MRGWGVGCEGFLSFSLLSMDLAGIYFFLFFGNCIWVWHGKERVWALFLFRYRSIGCGKWCVRCG